MIITKKLITLALAAMLLLGLAAPAMATDSDFDIQADGEGFKFLIKYLGSGGDAVVPDGVDVISYGAFDNCTALKSVTIPSSVAIIDKAFSACPNLTDIYFGGTEEKWAAITADSSPIFDEGANVTVHYNSTGPDASAAPATPETPAAPETSATPLFPGFTDVAAGAWYAEAVKWAVEKNITTGTSATTFSPETTCTTAQILTFLWRACGSPKTEAANGFTDVSASDYFYDAALWAGSKGMVSGDTLSPDTPCTRASTVMFIWQAKDKPASGSASSFTDVPADADYAAAVAWAVENSVTSGTSATTFSPADTCTRSQIVTFLNRAFAD